MEELPENLKEEIEALDSLDARALRRRYASSSLNTPSGLIMNPKRLSYLQAGWKFLDLQPFVDPPPEGSEYRITNYTETATDIQAVFKLVPVVSPPRTFSKLRLVTALTERGLWAAIRDWLDETGYYDLFATARTRFSLTPDQIATILTASVAD